ncbi:hypothetical protein [Synechocystis sp. PCC 7509]|uniref:hypothetical protein n=1 Tax=Synechocystis sp. PCC 7509 TaxID=927677 RepID=UPI0002ABE66F|nr:hypothetical protein [Synechocystis sp. PCC 7509]
MATEQQELQSLFDTSDSDQDGKVSINELFLSPSLSAIISSPNRYQFQYSVVNHLFL